MSLTQTSWRFKAVKLLMAQGCKGIGSLPYGIREEELQKAPQQGEQTVLRRVMVTGVQERQQQPPPNNILSHYSRTVSQWTVLLCGHRRGAGACSGAGTCGKVGAYGAHPSGAARH